MQIAQVLIKNNAGESENILVLCIKHHWVPSSYYNELEYEVCTNCTLVRKIKKNGE